MSTSRTQSHIRGGVALSAALLGFAIASAASGSEAPLPTLTVSYADLNLSRIQDAHRLYHRLQLASVSVCGNFGESGLPLQVEWQRCYQQALAKAVVTVNAPLLQAVYAVRTDHAAG
jgi:UrcA family protein